MVGTSIRTMKGYLILYRNQAILLEDDGWKERLQQMCKFICIKYQIELVLVGMKINVYRPALVTSHTWASSLTNTQVVLLSATLSELDITFIENAFNINIDTTITDLHIRPNIEYAYVDLPQISALETIHTLLKHPNCLLGIMNNLFDNLDHLIVFLESRKGVRALSEATTANGTITSWIESGTPDEQKDLRLKDWLSGWIKVLFGTSALSLGVSNPKYAGVIHLGLPRSVYVFMQETGRCGRRGQPSRCITLSDKSYEYNEMCRRIERIEKSKNYSATDTVIGNNALNAWFVVTQRRTCTQVLMLHYAGVKESPPPCGKCSPCRFPEHFPVLDLVTPLRSFLPRIVRLDTPSKGCLLCVASRRLFAAIRTIF